MTESVKFKSEHELKGRLKRARGSRRLPTYDEIEYKQRKHQSKKLARVKQCMAQEPFTRPVGHKTVLTDFRSEENGDSENSE